MAAMIPLAFGTAARLFLGNLAKNVMRGVVVGIATMWRSRVGQFIALGLLWLGLSIGTYTVAIQPTLDLIGDLMTTNHGTGNVAVAMRQWIGVIKFDIAVSMIVSAYGIRKLAQAGRVFLKRRAG